MGEAKTAEAPKVAAMANKVEERRTMMMEEV